MKRLATVALGVVFIGAGVNHFIHPNFYLPLIPPYLPWHNFLNVTSGILEIGLGISVLLLRFRRRAAIGIIILMILFIPAHIYMIQMGGCIPGSFCVPAWVVWVRLVMIQPLIIAWAWWVGNKRDVITLK